MKISFPTFFVIWACAVCLLSGTDGSGDEAIKIDLVPQAWVSEQIQIRLSGPLGYDYVIQSSENLTGWTSLATNFPSLMPYAWTDVRPPATGARFYRVLASVHLSQLITNISPAAALVLLQGHAGDPQFVIIDVRTPAEYSARHIKGAVNIDFYSSSFRNELDRLDRTRIFLLYCASGNRSRQAVEVMRQFAFQQVYGMLNGLGSFALLPGAGAYLEP